MAVVGQADWSAEPISLATFSAPDISRPSLEEFRAVLDAVFVDGSGYTNLAADMCAATLNVVRFKPCPHLTSAFAFFFDLCSQRQMLSMNTIICCHRTHS